MLQHGNFMKLFALVFVLFCTFLLIFQELYEAYLIVLLGVSFWNGYFKILGMSLRNEMRHTQIAKEPGKIVKAN